MSSVDRPADHRPPLSALEGALLNGFQRDFPLTPTPYAALAAELGVGETEVLEMLHGLSEAGVISRIGPVFRVHRIGVSTLAAMSVPPTRLPEVAAQVSALPEVNHNYEREHRFNLWFVVTAGDEEHLETVLEDIEHVTGLSVMSLPMQEDYHIDLGFKLSLNHL